MPAKYSNAATTHDVIILGAGGAGLMCAGVAGQRGKRVALLDHADAPGKKILISGGGRCNFTNLDVRPTCYLSNNPHFVKSALTRYTAQDFIALVEAYKIAWHEKTLGQLFCDGSAKQIVELLLAECDKGHVDLSLNAPIHDIRHSDGVFTVASANGNVSAPVLVLATGGPSIPKMGATGFAYEVAKQFGLEVIPPRPALVPLTLGDEDAPFKTLSGVAFESIAQIGKTAFREAALFTHKGLSGPAILQISSYWQPGDTITLNMVPGHGDDFLIKAKRARPKVKLQSALSSVVSNRFAAALAEQIGDGDELGNMSDKRLAQITTQLQHWSFCPTGSEGFAKAEVTAGGIATTELSSKTMESNTVPGLFCIGEAVDVTGWLGGYNFQWAWASGVVAGEAV